METVEQLVQIGGALAILTAFILVQMGRLDGDSIPYLVLNLAGSFVLAVDAGSAPEWGFLLLEGVWAIAQRSESDPRPAGGRPAGPPATDPCVREVGDAPRARVAPRRSAAAGRVEHALAVSSVPRRAYRTG